ncbi:MAG: inositol-3-phosphate synthase [Deltaproteobacteria bacterium]|nr:inositol-3-phosphate synthase [Deltaproteobacteria bacterium]
MNRTGVLFIGASGYISAAVLAGAASLKKGLCERTGMVTEAKEFSSLGLPEPEEMVFGGWDVRDATALQSAERFIKSVNLGEEVLSAIKAELADNQANFYRGYATNCGRAIESLARNAAPESHLKDQLRKLRSDIADFKKRNSVDEAVVINLASTEPPIEASGILSTPEGLLLAVDDDRKEMIRASTLYALAAVLEGCPYVNFTPSNGALVPGIVRLAEENAVPVMGNDGKTGETLVKSALVPMFVCRNLEVLSWEGFNMLGNMDGQVLDTPENRESKIISKDALLPKALGYTPHSRVHIHYVPSLDDQKTAWNFIHFKGFMGAKMTMQFVWQGFDSILAAPLVLDLARLSVLAKRRGEAGLMTHLASFFKAPLGVEAHCLHDQHRLLVEYANAASAERVAG